MTTKDRMRFLVVRTIGNFLVLFAIFGVLATFGPALYYEVQFRIIQVRGVHFSVSGQIVQANKVIGTPEVPEVPVAPVVVEPARAIPGFGDILSGPTEQILTPIDPNFSILIPKVGANAKVFRNVDPGNPDVFLPILKEGVAHAAGTYLPGQKGNIYLFAHSTDNFWDVGRYNAIFYLLKDLNKDDEIVIFFQNVRHNYRVTKTEITSSSNVSYISHASTGKELLILQTCWPPGTTWQRLLVFAGPK